MSSGNIVIVTGLSGSGKTTVIKAMEDLGFFCVDNLPLPLLDKILYLAETRAEVSRICIGIDVRERSMLDLFATEVAKVRDMGHRLEIIYLEASEDAIVRRYSETRRRHPLESVAGTVREGVERESAILSNIRLMADWVIDTTDINIHDLTTMIQRAYDKSASSRMAVEVISFGFRDGVPRDVSYVFDCRCLENPHFVDGLRPLTGAHAEVLDYLRGTANWQPFIDRVTALLELSLPLHEVESRPIVTVAFGCTGGRHRSVAAAETVAAILDRHGFRVRVGHRNQEVAEEVAALKRDGSRPSEGDR